MDKRRPRNTPRESQTSTRDSRATPADTLRHATGSQPDHEPLPPIQVGVSPYTGFPLVEIDGQGVRSVRRTPVRSASAVVTAGDRSAFLAATGKHPQTPGVYELTIACHTGGPIEAVSSTPLLLPDGTRPRNWAWRRACRDNRMWLQFDDPFTWYVIEI
jgi:hypothetical protein